MTSPHLNAQASSKLFRFGDLIENVTERAMPSETDSGTYVGLEHLSSDTMTPATGGSKTALKGEKIRVKKGDVLFARRNPHLRRVGVAQVDGLFSAHGMALRTKNPSLLLQEFLPHFVASSTFMDRVNQIAVGSLSKTVNWKPLAKQEFALPPLEEQKRIVEVQSSIDGLRALVKEGLQTAQNLKQAQLELLFDPTADDKTDLRHLADFHNGFPFKPRDLNGNGLPVVRIRQLLDPQAPMDCSDVEVPTACMLSDGDLVFAWSGTLAVRRWTRGPAKLNQHLFRVVEHSGVSSAWLQYALEHALRSLVGQTHGTAMKHITKTKLLSFAVRAQSAEEQEAAVSQLSATDSLLNSLTEEEERLRVLGRAVRERMLHVS